MDDRILVVKLAGIGDLLTATPALRALRLRFPSAHLAALVPPASMAVLEGSGLVDEIIPFDKFRYDNPRAALDPRALADALGFLGRLRGHGFTRVAILHHLITRWGTAKYAALALASGAARRLGADNGRGWFLTERMSDGGYGARHEVQCWLDLVGLWGAHHPAPRLEFPRWAGDDEMAAHLLAPRGDRPLVALHPGTGGYAPARQWPAARFARLADALAAQWGAGIVLVGGSEEAGVATEVAGQMRSPALNLAGMTSLPQLAAILRRCALLVCNDGGVMHLATAVDTPVVAIFGPSNHRAWGPWTDPQRSRVVRVELPCSPCLYVGHTVGRRHGCAAMTCLQQVTPEMVLAAAEAIFHRRDAEDAEIRP